MAEFPISVNERRNRWIAAASQTTFDYEFPIFDETELEAIQTLAATGVDVPLVLNVDYTVTGVDNPLGGTIILTTGAAAGDVITIEGDTLVARAGDFQFAGDFRTSEVNREFDRLVLMMQEIVRELGRSVRLSTADPTADMTLPALADRLGKYAGWDVLDGEWVPLAAPVDTAAVSAFMATVLTSIDAATSRNRIDAAPHGYHVQAQAVPDMTVKILTGSFFDLVAGSRVVSGVQNTATLTAPSSNPRNDLIVVDRVTGVMSVVAGAEAATPLDPAIPAGSMPAGRLRLTVGMTEITTADIDDLRELELLGAGSTATKNIGTSGDAVPLANTANSWAKAQRGAVAALTDGANIAVDFDFGNFSVTLAGNRTLDNPTNQVAGQTGMIVVKQDATGGRTLAYGTNWYFENGIAPVLSTAADAIDVLTYAVESPGVILTRLSKGWAPS